MVVAIPCSRLSKRILESEFGEEPIRLSRRSLLWPIVRPLAHRDRLGKTYVSKREAEFKIKVDGSTGKLIREHASDAGIVLHRYHLDMMLRFVEAAGPPYRASLQRFQEEYNITDDDYDLDSAYRAWLRFKSEKEKKRKKHCRKNTLHVAPHGKPGDRLKPSTDDLDKFTDFILSRLRYLWAHLPEYVFRQVHIYIYVTHGRRSTKQAAEHFGRPVRTIRHSVKKIRDYVETWDEFARLVEPSRQFAPVSG